MQVKLFRARARVRAHVRARARIFSNSPLKIGTCPDTRTDTGTKLTYSEFQNNNLFLLMYCIFVIMKYGVCVFVCWFKNAIAIQGGL